MQVLGVVGATGTGTTATAVNLVAALRREGYHAAVLDFTGDVADWFDVETKATLGEAVRGDASSGDAAETVSLPHGDVSDALAEYAAALGRDQTAFRAGDIDVDPGEPEPGELPVLVGGPQSAFDDATAEEMDAIRADLAFAYDYVVADAGTLGAAVATLLDGVVAVTDPQEESITTAQRGISMCIEEDLPVAGAVINRATDRTDISLLSDRLATTILGVIPEDERTTAIEPIALTAPDSPAAMAYGRLTEKLLSWDGESGVIGDGPEPPVAADGNGDDDTSSGLIGRLSDRFR